MFLYIGSLTKKLQPRNNFLPLCFRVHLHKLSVAEHLEHRCRCRRSPLIFPKENNFKSKFQFNQVRAGDFLSLVVLGSLPGPPVPKRGPAWECSRTKPLPVPGPAAAALAHRPPEPPHTAPAVLIDAFRRREGGCAGYPSAWGRKSSVMQLYFSFLFFL